jgi:hypothetical protein
MSLGSGAANAGGKDGGKDPTAGSSNGRRAAMSSAYTVTRGRSWYRFSLGFLLGAGLGIIVPNFLLVRPAQSNVRRMLAVAQMQADAQDKQKTYTDQILDDARRMCETTNACLALLDPKHKPSSCNFK